MRRLARILVNALTALLLFLFLATIILWVRSYWRVDSLKLPRTQSPGARQHHWLESSNGKLRVCRYEYGTEASWNQSDLLVRDALDSMDSRIDASPSRESYPMKRIPIEDEPWSQDFRKSWVVANRLELYGGFTLELARPSQDEILPSLIPRWLIPGSGEATDVATPPKIQPVRLSLRRIALAIPYWALALPTGGPGAWVTWKVLRRRRRKILGLCPACGYDLRATPDRCPECGKVPEAAPNSVR